MKKHARIVSLQYYIRPIDTFQNFVEQVQGLVATAADYKADLLVFPEYFTLQLLTLNDQNESISLQVKKLADYKDKVVELLGTLAVKHKLYIVGGSIPSWDAGDGKSPANVSYIFGPGGKIGMQAKLHMTRFEREEWFISAGKTLRVFDTEIGRVSINICYDVEFPELAREAARNGANLLIVPSCTDDRQGYLRVRYCAHARAIENQLYVVHSVTVGSLPMLPAVAMNYGQASILTPSDFQFSRDGIRAEGVPNQEALVMGDLDMEAIESSRKSGTVLPLLDSAGTAEAIAKVEIIDL